MRYAVSKKIGVADRNAAAVTLGLIFLVTIVCQPGESLASSAAEVVYDLEQPDGRKIQALTRGDEWLNWEETTEGYAISRASDKYWYYVTEYVGREPVLGKTRADSPPPPGIQRHRRPQLAHAEVMARDKTTAESLQVAPRAMPFSGQILFILAEFNDRAGSTTEVVWASAIADEIADYYTWASRGSVTLQPANESSGTANNGVVDWVNIGYNHPDTGSVLDDRNRELTRDAIVAADPFVDFSTYDGNGDGYVDAYELAVVVVAAGYERAYSSLYAPSVWGHKSYLSGTVSAPTVDGVKVGDHHSGAGGYAQFGELHRSSAANEHQATMGIMVHELAHLIFGLPDLYDTDGSSSGIGAFGVMGKGNWGRAPADLYSGETPVMPCAWTRYTAGWIDMYEFTIVWVMASGSDGGGIINPVAYRASTCAPLEYFLVENRGPYGYDRGLDRWLSPFVGGIAIWHVDDQMSSNSDDSHRWVDLEEADGTDMGGGQGENSDFWYDGNGSEFDANSTPSSDLYSGSASSVRIIVRDPPQEHMLVFTFSAVCEGIPTLSEWGLVGLSLLLVAAGTYTLRRRLRGQAL
jgi:M6 family metalloprotease-like protein